MTDWGHYREIADAGGRMPFNAAAIRSMLDEIDHLETERDDARRWAVRLEGMLAAAQERASEDLEREHARWRASDARAVDAERQRDAVLGRLATSNGDVAAYRHQRDQARAERDEVVAALAALVASLDDDVTCDPADDRAARTLVARYRSALVTATIESHAKTD